MLLAATIFACRSRSRPSTLPESPTQASAGPSLASTREPDSALSVEDLQIGSGATAAIGKKVSLHYTGWLKGAKFDTSLARKPLEFRLGKGEVLRGWDEGIPGMKVGGKRKLTLRPEMGYGSNGSLGGAIPPNSVLVFEIELVAVND